MQYLTIKLCKDDIDYHYIYIHTRRKYNFNKSITIKIIKNHLNKRVKNKIYIYRKETKLNRTKSKFRLKCIYGIFTLNYDYRKIMLLAHNPISMDIIVIFYSKIYNGMMGNVVNKLCNWTSLTISLNCIIK